jgi:hypothetical protein
MGHPEPGAESGGGAGKQQVLRLRRAKTPRVSAQDDITFMTSPNELWMTSLLWMKSLYEDD